jgi:phospholipid-binding lipoprotein MlaA
MTPIEPPAPGAVPAAPPAAAAPASPAPGTPAPAADTPAPAADTTVPTSAVPAAATTPTTTKVEAGQTLPATPGSTEIVVSGEHNMRKVDPVEGANKVSFQAMEGIDKALVGPIAHAYRDVLPRPVRLGLHNFFYNLSEPVNIINYMLQLHPGKAAQTLARFGINSTIGIAGLIDVAKKKPFNIHYRPNGFENTMGYYGIGPGPYFFLPLIGATSLRDLIGTLLDQAVLPAAFPKPFSNTYYVTAAGVITGLDYRVTIDEDLEKVRKSDNVYVSYRQAYLRTRYWEIEALHGRGPLAKGVIGEAPFAHPLYPEPDQTPVPAPPGATAPAPALTPALRPAPAPEAVSATPPPPVFISQPVVQPHPTVQPLPPGYRPGGS